jgi:hypothetical protein
MEQQQQHLLTRRGAPARAVVSTAESALELSTASDILLVFGGSGFVGSAVVTAALEQHSATGSVTTTTTTKPLQILVISRTGKAPAWYGKDPILGKAIQDGRLHFLTGDMRTPNSPEEIARAIVPWTSNPANTFLGVISCIGCITLWDNQNMLVTNGEANINAYKVYNNLPRTTKDFKPKYCVISRDRSNWNDWWYVNISYFPGYYEGKRVMDDFLMAQQEDNKGYCVSLQAGCVSGIRHTIPEMQGSALPFFIPLQLCCPYGCPLWCLFKVIEVEELGAAAVRFLLSQKPSDAVWIENKDIKSFFLE